MEKRKDEQGSADGFLSADDILSAEDSRYEVIDVPEWGGSVRIRTMGGYERGALEVMWQRKNGAVADFRERFAAICICDAKGERLFRDDQLKALGKKSAPALERVFDAAAKLNRFSTSDVEELAGN